MGKGIELLMSVGGLFRTAAKRSEVICSVNQLAFEFVTPIQMPITT